MNFVSFKFWITLALLLIVRLFIVRLLTLFDSEQCISKNVFDRIYLFFTSVTLFALEDYNSFFIFLGVSFLIFGSMANYHFLPKVLQKAFCLVVCLIAILPLLFYKYAPLINMGPVRAFTFDELLIPIGLSFYTFQLISLFVDEIKEAKMPLFKRYSILDILNFASFFPQIVAGPIERGKSLLPQMKNFTFSVNSNDFILGVKFIITGAFYKLVIADSIAQATPWIVKEISHPLLIHLSNLAFGLRIYGDFCGYSFMALGIARIFGVTLTLNFRSPYTQRNLQYFWRSWHISLTNWFRDYVYIPLGGNRVLWSILIVFALSGIWHGAGWGFLIWGLFHGIGLTFIILCSKRIKLPAFVSWLLTSVFVSTGWLPFYQWESSILFAKIENILTASAYFTSPVMEFKNLASSNANMLFFVISLLLGVVVIGFELISRLNSKCSPKEVTGYLWCLRPSVQYCMVVMIIIYSPTQENGFVYFNF